MAKIVECVPNFSEGRDLSIIKQITDVIENVSDVKLLDVDPGADTNRTVVTFIGTPSAVKEAAFLAIKKASEIIDMRKHKGAHARQGATDVCPFVPVSEVTMEDCVEIAKQVGERVGKELGIPIYLYEEAASSEKRRNLAFVRSGQYEGLADKFKNPELKPDFGPCEMTDTVYKAGATAISAREFLIAYNINLNTKDKKHANEIAFNIREMGRAKRGVDTEIIRDEKGFSIKMAGKYKNVKSVGWYIDEYQRAQVSMNLTNYKITPIHTIFEDCCHEAEKIGVRVTGSELVGLVPKEALLQAGRYYMQKMGKSISVPDEEIIHHAVLSLGLSEITPFKNEEKIIEYFVEKPGQLISMTVKDFINEVCVDSPAPGGGSVAALAGGLGAALGAMVTNLTMGKVGYEEYFNKLEEHGVELAKLMKSLTLGIDKDTEAFNDVIDAMRLPQRAPEEIKIRDAKMLEGYKKATEIPLDNARACLASFDHLEYIAKHGNQNSASDAGVGALMAYAGLVGTVMNVRINLPNISDKEFVDNMIKATDTMIGEAREKCDKIVNLVMATFK